MSTAVGEKRDRDGDSTNNVLQQFKARHRAAWPEPEALQKFTTAIKSEAEHPPTSDKKPHTAVKAFAEYIYRFHDQPHNARLEWWYINGHAGTDKTTNNSYSFFAAFFRLHIMGDHYAYAVNWALTEAPALETVSETGEKTQTVPNPPTFVPAAGSANVGKYFTFALQDPITPIAIDTLMTKGRFKMADPRVAKQLQTIARAGLLPAPDNMFTTPSVCRGSSDKDETLHVEIEGNVFSAHFPKGAAAPTYTMKLTGTTARGDTDIPETTATLEMTFSPDVESGFGPVLQGRNGVVSVENFEDDMFYYFSPRCRVPTETHPTKLTVNGKEIPLTTNGEEEKRIWIDHEFGGAPAITEEERTALEQQGADKDYEWDWGALHIPGLASIGMAIVREENPAIPPMIWAAIQPEYSLSSSAANGCNTAVAPAFSAYFDPSKPSDDPTQPIRIEVDTSVPTFSSPDTGLIFPTAFTIHIPSLKNLKMRTVVAIPQQEFINLMAKPSYLEGRSNIEATWTEETVDSNNNKIVQQRHIVTGMGFQEARGKLNKLQIEQIAMITHATVFMPAEMQPAPPLEAVSLLPAAALPQINATVSAMMAFAPPPKPKPNQIHFIAATVATYVSLLHFGAETANDEANAKQFIQFWIDQKYNFLTATKLGERAGIKEIGLAALMQKEIESMIVRKVPSVISAIAAMPAAATKEEREAVAMKYIFDVEDRKSGESKDANMAAASATTSSPTSDVSLTSAIDAAAAIKTTTESPILTQPRALVGHYKLPIPRDNQMAIPSTEETRNAFASAVDGRWIYCNTLNVDNVSEFLGAQGVNIIVRMFAASVKPSINSKMIHDDGGRVETIVELMIGNQLFVSQLNGKQYTFEASGRGTISSRAALLYDTNSNNVILVQRNAIPCGPKGVEYKIFDVTTLGAIEAAGLKDGQKMPANLALTHPIVRETSVYYTQAQVDKAVLANSTENGQFDSDPTAMMTIFYYKDM